MLSVHLPITQLSSGSTIFCLHAKIIFLSVLIPLTLSALMLICKGNLSLHTHPPAEHPLCAHTFSHTVSNLIWK